MIGDNDFIGIYGAANINFDHVVFLVVELRILYLNKYLYRITPHLFECALEFVKIAISVMVVLFKYCK